MSTDAVVELQGEVKMSQALSAVIRIDRRLRGQQIPRFDLDCSKVIYFTGHALTELAIAKRKLRSAGSDLVLIHCTSEVEQTMRVPIFQALLN